MFKDSTKHLTFDIKSKTTSFRTIYLKLPSNEVTTIFDL